MSEASENFFSITSMSGHPNEMEIAALTSAISLWAMGLTTANPQDILANGEKSVDNSYEILRIMRSANRNSLQEALVRTNFGNRTSRTWALGHRVRARK